MTEVPPPPSSRQAVAPPAATAPSAATRTSVTTTHIWNQPLLTAKMRRTLVLWLSEVCQEFHLSDMTYHLAITLLDQTLCQNTFPIHREQFQAVGWYVLGDLSYFPMSFSSQQFPFLFLCC
jgi:hypothetical protein